MPTNIFYCLFKLQFDEERLISLAGFNAIYSAGGTFFAPPCCCTRIQRANDDALSSRRGRIIVIFWIGAIRLRDRQFAMATFCPLHFPASIDPRTERQWQYCL